MCGFSGQVSARPDPDAGETVAAMVAAMRSRGPDGVGFWEGGTIALGHCRLKIIDLSDAAAQPMVDPASGVAVAFNGCIYNYRDLRRELEGLGHRFLTGHDGSQGSDTEVLLRAHLEWGDGFVERLQGMFAFCIADPSRGRVLLGRDRLGIKPLYLAESGGVLRFASTLPALLESGAVDTTVDPVALHHYLTFHSVVPAPRTILAGVRKLPPATTLVLEADGRRREQTYWAPAYERDPERQSWSARDWEDAVLERLRTAVQRRLVADVPVGCLLSGGLDSSLVVALLAEAGQHGLATFSVGFESHGGIEGDEFRYSDVVAERYDTDHHRIRIDGQRLLPALDAAIGAMAEPMVSHDCVGFHLLAEEVSKHVRVVQSGQGADEVFGGYHWYPPLLEPAASSAAGALAAYRQAFFDRDHASMAALVEAPWRLDHDASGDLVRRWFEAPGAATGVDRALRLDTSVMLVEDPVKRVDNMTMAWGLEARVPFLDHELVELAAACPPELKLADGGKGVLKAAARRLLPAEVIDRPKGYFPVPALTHLGGPVLDLVAGALRAPAAKERGLFRSDAVEALMAAPNEGLTPLRGNRLWQIGLLELWLQRHVDGSA